MHLNTNMGIVDRVIRILIAALFVTLNVSGTVSGALAIVLWVLAAVFLLTSVVAFCPLYLPFGLSTKGR
jgi:hypothetical protein